MSSILYRFGFLFIAILLFGGCTSIRYDQYRQHIRVLSSHGGAEIYENKTLLGITPAIVQVRRGLSPVLTLKYRGQQGTRVKVKTRYRWIDSGFTGIFFPPYAWGIDLLTGTAWDLKDVKDVQVPGRPPEKLPVAPMSLIVAPPLAGRLNDSLYAEEQLRLFFERKYEGEGWKILDSSSFSDLFEDYQYTFESRPGEEKLLALAYELTAKYIVHSEVQNTGQGLVVAYIVKDRLTDQILSQDILRLKQREFIGDEFRFLVWLKKSALESVPNVFAFDFASQRLSLELKDEPEIIGQALPQEGFLGQAAQFLGGLSATSLIPPRGLRSFGWGFRFSPLFTFAYTKYDLGELAAVTDMTPYQLTRLSAGLGPEVFLETRLGVFYAHFVPGLSYSKVSWKSYLGEGNHQFFGGNYAIGAGYYQYFSGRWVLRLFTRTIREPTGSWQTALERSQGRDYGLESAFGIYSGVSLGFYFPEIRRALKRR